LEEDMAEQADLAQWFGAHHGVVTRAWLQQHGVTDGQVRQMRESGRIVEAHRGVYRSSASPRTQNQRMAELVACTGGAISHTSAGQIWGFRKLNRYRDVHLSVTQAVQRRFEGDGLDDVVLHRSSTLPASDLVVRGDGLIITAPARTVFDLAAVIPEEDLESIIEQGLAMGRFSLTKLLGVEERLATSGRKGTKQLRRVLASRSLRQRPVDSDYELRLVRALEDNGLPAFERQMPLRLSGGELVHPDLAEPTRRFIVEVDHATWHVGEKVKMYDHWRDRQYHLLGWHSERVSDKDIDQRLPETVQELLAIYRSLPVVGA
jgi:very-short-patch-repair endonuclease